MCPLPACGKMGGVWGHGLPPGSVLCFVLAARPHAVWFPHRMVDSRRRGSPDYHPGPKENPELSSRREVWFAVLTSELCLLSHHCRWRRRGFLPQRNYLRLRALPELQAFTQDTMPTARMSHPLWSGRGRRTSASSPTAQVSLACHGGGRWGAEPPPQAAVSRVTGKRLDLHVAPLPRSRPLWSWSAATRPPTWRGRGHGSSGHHSLRRLGWMLLGWAGGASPSRPSTGPVCCQTPCLLPPTATPRSGTQIKSMKICWTTLTHSGPGLNSQSTWTATHWPTLSCRTQV